MYQYRTFRICALLIFSILLSSSGCSKKSSNESVGIDSLVARIPSSSVAFAVWNPMSEAYSKLRNSDWNKSRVKIFESVFEATADDPKTKVFWDLLRKMGLLGNPGEALKINNASAYIINTGNKEPSPIIVTEMSNEENAKVLLSELNESLKKENLDVTESCEGFEGFEINLDNTKTSTPKDLKVSFCRKENKVAVGINTEDINNALSDKPIDANDSIVSSPNYKKALTLIASRQNEYRLAYADFERIKSMAPETESAPSGLLGFILSGQMLDAPTDAGAIVLDETTKDLKHLFSEKSGLDSLTNISKASAIAFAFGSGLVRSIESNLDKNDAEMMKTFDFLKSLNAVVLSIEPAQAGSPFPNINIIASGISSDDVQQGITKAVSSQMDQNGLSMGAWQSKEVAGTKMHYLASPFGVGLYIGTKDNQLVVSSSEQGFKESFQGKSDNLYSTLKKRDVLAGDQVLFVGHLNFSEISNILGSLQQTFAMFTGGQSSFLNEEQLNTLKQMGQMTATIGVKDNNLTFSSSCALDAA